MGTRTSNGSGQLRCRGIADRACSTTDHFANGAGLSIAASQIFLIEER
jgi:hypothetical protein